LSVDVLGQKVDVFVVDVLKVDVLEVAQMGRPVIKRIYFGQKKKKKKRIGNQF
jgi:hypothetical protein